MIYTHELVNDEYGWYVYEFEDNLINFKVKIRYLNENMSDIFTQSGKESFIWCQKWLFQNHVEMML